MRPESAHGKIMDMTNVEMERALEKFTKRTVGPKGSAGGGFGAPQSARTLLEENKQLIQEKRERKALERKNSRDFTESLLAKSRVVNLTERAKNIGLEQKKRELAHYYKSKIAEKEEAKSNEYNNKVERGLEIQYFPFVEGETILKCRSEQGERMREEMRSFLNKQREENPPRSDLLLADVDMNYSHKYPSQHGEVSQLTARSGIGVLPGGALPGDEDEVAPHMQRHPRFLTRAREHMSRRLHDQHVRAALEDKVKQTRTELEALARQKMDEDTNVGDGILVSDTLRVDQRNAKAAERRKNADYLRDQMESKRTQKSAEKHSERAEQAGYWGPEEKAAQSQDTHRELCGDLIKQMEVDQHRRLDSRSRRLRQERRLIDNCMAEMMQDRDIDRQKAAQHKEVLVTTWASQKRIKEAKAAVT